jgi:hypothetical protein
VAVCNDISCWSQSPRPDRAEQPRRRAVLTQPAPRISQFGPIASARWSVSKWGGACALQASLQPSLRVISRHLASVAPRHGWPVGHCRLPVLQSRDRSGQLFRAAARSPLTVASTEFGKRRPEIGTKTAR